MPKFVSGANCANCGASLINPYIVNNGSQTSSSTARAVKKTSFFSILKRIFIFAFVAYMFSPIIFDKLNLDSSLQTQLSKMGSFIDSFSIGMEPRKFTLEEKALIKNSFAAKTKFRKQKIQYQLKSLNYYSGTIDGIWGKGTESAVVNFGEILRLDPDPLTLFKKLDSRVAIGDEVLFKKLYATLPIKLGENSYNGTGSRIAPFSVSVPKGSDYFIWLKEAGQGKDVLTAYIAGGTTFKTKAPLGAYELEYISGSDWYGKKYLFGIGTTIYKANKTWVFNKVGRRINGTSVTLQRVTNGNLSTSTLGKLEF